MRLDGSARHRLWAIHGYAAQSRLESRLLSTRGESDAAFCFDCAGKAGQFALGVTQA
jgi:hypothetical protein